MNKDYAAAYKVRAMQSNAIEQDAVELLKALVAIPSVSGNEKDAASMLQAKLESWFPGNVACTGHNLIVTLKGVEAGSTLMLCSHIDTISPAAGWTKNPFAATVEGSRIYGLGANDAGASVVSMIAAARLLQKPSKGTLQLCLVAEEEAGNQGFVKIEPEVPRYDAAIFGEPTDMGMATSMRGAMKVTVHSHGIACHASRPWEGKNACDQLVKDLTALRCIAVKDGSAWGGATIEPTMVKGGQSPNQIPDLIETLLDIRTTPEKNNEWVLDELKKSGVDFKVQHNRRRPMQNDAASRLVQAVKRGAPDVPDYVFNGTCDMAFATAPSIVLGPGRSERSHAADEFIEEHEIRQAIGIYRDVADAFLS